MGILFDWFCHRRTITRQTLKFFYFTILLRKVCVSVLKLMLKLEEIVYLFVVPKIDAFRKEAN